MQVRFLPRGQNCGINFCYNLLMIIPNKEYRLGTRSFMVSSLRNVFAAIVMFLVAIFLSAMSGIFISTGNSLFESYSPSTGGNIIDITPYVFMAISLIFFLSFLIFIVGLIISWLSYENFTFNFKEFEIRLKKGIINKEEVSIPYHQAANVHVDRNLLYQLFGVSRLVINTDGVDDSGSGEEEATFDPIDKRLAEQMQALLQSRIGVQIVEQKK